MQSVPIEMTTTSGDDPFFPAAGVTCPSEHRPGTRRWAGRGPFFVHNGVGSEDWRADGFMRRA